MKSTKILVTEDELLVGLDLRRRLENLGYTVVDVVPSGEEAIEKARLLAPDLVMMDIVLQGSMDGIEAATIIRNQFEIPVIYLTANTDLNTVQRAEHSHPFNYLLKPLKEVELKISIEIALYHHQVSQQLRQARDELEIRVQERTAELLEANAALRQELEQHVDTENKLRRSQDEARIAANAKSEFMSRISHELFTPMNGIVGMTDLLLSGELTAEQREQTEIIRSSADALSHLLKNVIEIANIGTDRNPIRNEPFDVRAVVDRKVRAAQDKLETSEVSVSFSVGADVPETLNGDGDLLGKVLGELLSNGVKFTHRGAVDLQVALLTKTEKAHWLKFSVSDTGIGVPEDIQDAIFDPFYQADGSITRAYRGVGLGLALAAQHVRTLGGSIWLESFAGHGGTFHCMIAFDSQSAAEETGGTSGTGELISDRSVDTL